MPGPTLGVEPVEPQSLKKLSFKSLKRALDLFSPIHGHFAPPDPESKKMRISYKVFAEYGTVRNLPSQPTNQVNPSPKDQAQQASAPDKLSLPGPEDSRDMQLEGAQNALVVGPSLQPKRSNDAGLPGKSTIGVLTSVPGSSERNTSTSALMERIPSKWPRPVWRPPWKNYRVISGHLGWVRSIAFDPSNTWFCTGSADRTIKIWDVGSGRLKLTLTGHIEQIRGLAVSKHHTYMFSAGDDKQVKCWDLEQNKVIRSYHGHLSGVYCLALHPTIDILLTGGRDSVCRVWDIRTKTQIHALSGHDNTVCSVFTRPTDPQVVTGSHDTTIKFWDLRYGKTMLTLTHHKKSVRAMTLHPKENCFASASADNIKKFNLPKGEFLHNMLSQQKTIINAMAVNEDGVMATAGDNGSLWFWDWRSGHNFQQAQTIVQPGSLDSEAGIYALSYDITGSRLVTCEADKTIKMWKEDENANPETHPLNFKPPKDIRRF
ncbi:PREDICTED: protein pleiotropic regulatory locus 1-like [Nelumbo nucifera]|uniref:Protein pleiotropic regulatory locus 1-like n=1 Tax=Nelumbo nucifera TaxID=4432 RepID=A0A1U8ABR6_NELNU|nr:PREDICTED: protein pleiotropic regulatory locus 1-like [Nelumbo nucifera]